MYADGQVLGAATTTGVAVTALPFTSGNILFQSLLLAAVVVAGAVLLVRLVKLAAIKRTQ